LRPRVEAMEAKRIAIMDRLAFPRAGEAVLLRVMASAGCI
jgi:hypothetical protein